ncbi:transcription termination factor NusA [Candidatus Peribacteria bacterium]|nr:transcription termination factor NusA [Candidatus Peribacteria bacterium]
MQSKLQAAINQLCAEKNLNKDIVIEAVENAIAVAYKRDFGSPHQNVKVVLGDDITDLRIFEVRDVVESMTDIDTEILLKDAKKIQPNAEIGDEVFVLTPPHENFGRIAAQTAKHIISQKLQEAEREMLFHKFKDSEGTLLTARVQKADGDVVLLEIDGVSTLLYRRGQIPRERYFTGQRLKVLLEKVESTTKGPQLRITRASKDFIVALFEQEIPELREGVVYPALIAREPGVRTKIAVASEDASVDPVGAFVGQRGSRINAVTAEVGDERIDVIQHYDDKKRMLKAALSPAKISKVEFYEGANGEERVKLFVKEEERAMTIGRQGQNVRLASQLLNLQIDVLTFDGPPEEDEALQEEKKTAASPRGGRRRKVIAEDLTIDTLDGIDPAVAALLSEMGLSQIKQYEGLKPEELAEVGITLEQAEAVMDAINSFINVE